MEVLLSVSRAERNRLGLSFLVMTSIVLCPDTVFAEGLPMAAKTVKNKTPLFEEDRCDDEVLRHGASGGWTTLGLSEGVIVGVWQQDGRCFRITPGGFSPEAWIRGSDIVFDPTLEVPIRASYLDAVSAAARERSDFMKVIGCAVMKRQVSRSYEEPNGNVTSWYWGPFAFTGSILPIHRRTDGWVELGRGEPSILASIRTWLPADDVLELTGCQEGVQCTREAWSYHRMKRDGALRDGPHRALPPVSFYGKGTKVRAGVRACNGWIRLDHFYSLKWTDGANAETITRAEYNRYTP